MAKDISLILMGTMLVLLIPVPIFAQEMVFYQNEKYDFSFEIPIDWRSQEDIDLEPYTYPVMFFPEEFSMENFEGIGENTFTALLLGLEFQLEAPLVSVEFRNVPESEVPTLTENNLQEYVELEIKSVVPDMEMIDSYTQSHSWGWEVYTKYTFDGNLGIGSYLPYTGEELIFVFKDREAYNVVYAAPNTYYDDYKPVYDHVLDTIIIKSVAVPEFEIAMLILISSIIPVILFSRKFDIVNFHT